MCIAPLCSMCTYALYIQANPDSDYAGWKGLSNTPELNFLSQIVVLLFENESQPEDSSSRYCIHLHIGSGVKARKQMFGDGVPFIDGETHSPSFVKRLPTLPAGHRGPESTPTLLQAPPTQTPPLARGVRKIASYPSMHPRKTPAIAVIGTPPTRRSSSSSFSGVTPSDVGLTSFSPDRKLTIGYTDESLQTLGEPGQFHYLSVYQHKCYLSMTYM